MRQPSDSLRIARTAQVFVGPLLSSCRRQSSVGAAAAVQQGGLLHHPRAHGDTGRVATAFHMLAGLTALPARHAEGPGGGLATSLRGRVAASLRLFIQTLLLPGPSRRLTTSAACRRPCHAPLPAALCAAPGALMRLMSAHGVLDQPFPGQAHLGGLLLVASGPRVLRHGDRGGPASVERAGKVLSRSLAIQPASSSRAAGGRAEFAVWAHLLPSRWPLVPERGR